MHALSNSCPWQDITCVLWRPNASGKHGRSFQAKEGSEDTLRYGDGIYFAKEASLLDDFLEPLPSGNKRWDTCAWSDRKGAMGCWWHLAACELLWGRCLGVLWWFCTIWTSIQCLFGFIHHDKTGCSSAVSCSEGKFFDWSARAVLFRCWWWCLLALKL